MRLKTTVNGEKIKNHVTYNLWKYILVIVAAVVVWGFLGDLKPSIPEDKKIEIYVMSVSTSSEIVDPFLETLWQETVPDMESVCSIMIPMFDEYTTEQFLVPRMFAREGDIFILTEDYFKSYASQGYFIPLEELIADGAIDVGSANLQNGYITQIVYDENGEPASSESHLCGIPLESFTGFASKIGLNTQDLYAAVTVYNRNEENVIPFLNAFLQEGKE